jgi:hypothetical protein
MATVWGKHMFALGPLLALLGIGTLVFILRWAFSGRNHSLISPIPKAAGALDYGLLTPIATPTSHIEAGLWQEALRQAGVRATITATADGPRLMVFSSDAVRATEIVSAFQKRPRG